MRKREILCFASALLVLLSGCGKTVSREAPAAEPTPAVTVVPAGPLPVEETPVPTEEPLAEATMSEAERAFAAVLTEQLLDDGYEAVEPAHYAARYRQMLLCPDALPACYVYLPRIFAKPDPRVSSQTLITQVWFDAESGEYLQFTQEDSELWVEESLRYEQREDAAEGGIRYRGVYKVRANDLAVTGLLYLSEDKGEDYCRGILTAIHFEKK